MLKLFKFLKKNIWQIFIIIGLLVVQANLDLSLPEYTSKIVNIGIQQNGIEEPIYDVISKSHMNKLSIFLSEEDNKIFLNSYSLIEKTSSNLKKYPLLSSEDIYELKSIDSIDKLKTMLAKPSLIIKTLESDNEYVKTIKENLTKQMGIEITSENIVSVLSNIPKETLDTMLKQFDTQIDLMPDSIIEQSGIACVKSEYEHIGINIGKIQTNYILYSGIKMLSIALLIMGVVVLILYLGSKLAATLRYILRSKVFSNVVVFSKSEMKKFGTASLITRTTNDITQVQQVVLMLLRVVFYAPIIAIGGIIKSTQSSTSMLWIIVVAVISLFFIIGVLFIIVMPKFQKLQNLVDRLNLVSREILNGIPVIRAFSNESHEEKRFDKANTDLTKVNLFVNRTMSLMMPLMMILMNAVCIAIVWFGAKGIDAGTFQIGDMMAYIQYAMQIIMAFLMISMISIMLPRASISAKRILEI